MFGDVSVDLLVSSGYGKCVSDVERYVGRANQGRIVYLILEFRSSVYQVYKPVVHVSTPFLLRSPISLTSLLSSSNRLNNSPCSSFLLSLVWNR